MKQAVGTANPLRNMGINLLFDVRTGSSKPGKELQGILFFM